MKITILMSTYNGELYLEEQLESLLCQKNVDIQILVRDDGSTDKTREILNKYAMSGHLTWYEGKNLKPAQSFLELVRNSGDSQYYAYCDQDDVWFDDKLITAINRLSQLSSKTPNLYVSTYDVVDDNLNFMLKRDMKYEIPYTLATTIVERCPSGCTMVFNKKVRDLIAIKRPSNVRMHDYWTMMIVEAFMGNIVYDSNSRLLYRQHRNNSVGFGKGNKTYIKRLLKSAFLRKNERQKQAIELYQLYKDVLPKESLVTLSKIANYRKRIIDRIKLSLDKEFETPNLKINLLFKISVLFGLF